MAYVVYSEDQNVTSAQQAEIEGHPFWPTVRSGHFGGCTPCAAARRRQQGLAGFGEEGGPLPLGVLGPGSVILVAAGTVVRGTAAAGGGELRLTAPVRFQIDKETAAVSLAPWTPMSVDVAFGKDVSLTALDPVLATPVPGGGEFSANPGWHGQLLAGVPFTVAVAGAGSDPRFAALTDRPAPTSGWSAKRIGMVIAVSVALVAAGLFAATLMLGGKKE